MVINADRKIKRLQLFLLTGVFAFSLLLRDRSLIKSLRPRIIETAHPKKEIPSSEHSIKNDTTEESLQPLPLLPVHNKEPFTLEQDILAPASVDEDERGDAKHDHADRQNSTSAVQQYQRNETDLTESEFGTYQEILPKENESNEIQAEKMNQTEVTNDAQRDLPVTGQPAVNELQQQQQQPLPGTEEATSLQEIEMLEEVEPMKNISFPIFVASLPKSGTGSVQGFLECGGISTGHYRVFPRKRHPLIGECAQTNVRDGDPIWQGCGDYQAFSDAGFAEFSEPYDCFFPSIQGLENIYEHYPESTIILGVRNTTEWFHSVRQWHDGGLKNAWEHCSTPHFPRVNGTDEEFMAFYEWHTDHIRSFAAARPSMKYVEVSLEAADGGAHLERELGISQDCWKHLHKSGKRKLFEYLD